MNDNRVANLRPLPDFTFFCFRLIFILILFFVLKVSTSQTINLNQKVTVIAKQKPLSEILDNISTIGKLDFSYSHAQIPLEEEISLSMRYKTLKRILKEVCTQAKIEYKVVENQVVLKPIKQSSAVETKKAVVDKFTISGYIKDKESGEVLIGATVYDTILYAGTTSNAYGFYSITLPAGNYNLRYSFIGYEDIDKTIGLYKNQFIPIDLDIDEAQLNAVIVKAEDDDIVIDADEISHAKILARTMEKNLGVMGETDFVKSLQTMPGIKAYGDGSTSFYVRGGNKDQNMILIDETPIYNPSHLLGLFSSISPSAIKDVKIYKGDVPASYGGRLSSLIDIRTKDGNMNRHSFYGDIGLITGSYTLEGPIFKEKSSYFLSLRKSHLEWLYRRNNPDQKITFHDLNTKLNVKINNNNRIYLSFYNGNDFFGEIGSGSGNFGLSWSNTALSLRWNHIFSNKLFSNTTIYSSLYEYFLYTDYEEDQYWNSYISNFSIKSDFTYYMQPQNTLRFGLKLNSHFFNPGNYHTGDNLSLIELPDVPERTANETVFYINNEQQPYDKWRFSIGFRMPVWQNVGSTTIYGFDDEYDVVDTTEYTGDDPFHTYVNLEPRLAISYLPSKKSTVKLAYSRTAQHLQLLSNSLSPFTSLEVWMPSGPNIKPQLADQYILGYNQQLKNREYSFSTEIYFKDMKNQIDYKDHPRMLLNPLLEGELRFGKAWSYGTEFMLSKNTGLLTGWISYTISRTWMKFDDINQGEKYPAFHDRPHDFSIYLDYMISERLSISSNWLYYTGSAFTSPTSFYYYQGYTVPIYTKRNNDRLPAYHRLDISTTYKLNKKARKFKHSLTLAIYNLYGRRNPYAINFNKAEFASNEFKIPGNLYVHPDLEPTKFSILGVIPSLKYRFRIN